MLIILNLLRNCILSIYKEWSIQATSYTQSEYNSKIVRIHFIFKCFFLFRIFPRIDFYRKNSTSDVVLNVTGKKFHVNKQVAHIFNSNSLIFILYIDPILCLVCFCDIVYFRICREWQERDRYRRRSFNFSYISLYDLSYRIFSSAWEFSTEFSTYAFNKDGYLSFQDWQAPRTGWSSTLSLCHCRVSKEIAWQRIKFYFYRR